jgi:hypothetical protein
VKRVIAVTVAILWAIGYLLAIEEHDAGIAAAATPVAMIALGWLLGRRNGNGAFRANGRDDG